jgi:NADPH:quinone reductase-like Zn-dependent oxidoreductase
MPRAVKFDKYGGIDVLRVVEVDRPLPGQGQVVVRMKAAGINPGEAAIREGVFAKQWPATFPSGEGSDLAGVVEEVGSAVRDVAVGDEVIGFTNNRSSHADLVVVEADHLIGRPTHVSWEQAGALFVAGTTAYAAVHAVALKADDTVVISSAAGGVGSIAVQLAKILGAKVIGLASAANHAWLAEHGVIAVVYGKASRIGSEPHREEKSMPSSIRLAAVMWIWRSNTVSRPIGSIRSSTSPRPQNTASRRRATARQRIPRYSQNLPVLSTLVA